MTGEHHQCVAYDNAPVKVENLEKPEILRSNYVSVMTREHHQSAAYQNVPPCCSPSNEHFPHLSQ